MNKYNNIIFITIFIIMSIFIVIFNKIIDPYNIQKYSERKKHFCLNNEPSEYAYTIMNLDKHNKYEYAMLGGSTLAIIFYHTFFYKLTNKTIFQICLGGISPEEEYEMLKDYIEFHPETKNIIIEISAHPYIRNYDEQMYKKQTQSEIFFKFYFSVDATNKSIKKLINKLNKNKTEQTPIIPHVETRPDLKYNYEFSSLDKNIESLKKIKELIDKKEINALFFAPPVHALHLANCYMSGTYKYYEDAKRTFAQITPFYDMSFISEYTTKKIDGKESYYYYDILHPSEFIMKEILPIIMNKEVDNKSSVLITQDNIESELIKQREKLKQYVENNQEYIQNYINNNYDPLRHEQSRKIVVYHKDLPIEIQKTYLKSIK